MNDQLKKAIEACLDDLSRCKPAQTDSVLLQHFAPVVAAVERDRDEWKRKAEVYGQRIYKVGLSCDEVPELSNGFCPEGHGERDNITRIKIALEYWKRKAEEAEIRGLRTAAEIVAEYRNNVVGQKIKSEIETEIKKLEAK